MHSKKTFLFLGLLALLAIGWLLSGHNNAATEPVSVAAARPPLPPSAAPPLSEEGSVRERQSLPSTEMKKEGEVVPQGEKPEFGEVHGRILDSYGRQVTEGRVLVFHKGKRVAEQELQGDDRTFSFKLEAPELYSLVVDPASLPAGYSPPLAKQRKAGLLGDPMDPLDLRFYAHEFLRVQIDGKHRMDLAVGLQASASGRVVDTADAPVPGVFVQIVRLDSLGGEFADRMLTDSTGGFRFDDLFPGNYRLNILVTKDQAPQGELWNPPPPRDVRIEGGQPHDFGSLVVGAGVGRIDGRIVDQEGHGFAGLPILAFSNEPVSEGLQAHDFQSQLASTTTDSEGYFSLQGLELMQVQISLTPGFEPGQAMGAGHPAMWVPNLEIDLEREGPIVNVGTTTVEESRPFLIHGSVVCDPAWLAAGHHLSEVRIEISQAEGTSLPEGVRRNPIRRTRLRLDGETGAFRHAVETPMTRLRARVTLRGFEPLDFLVTPIPMQDWSQQIRIPSDLEKSP